MADYQNFKLGKLKLKGQSSKPLKKKKKFNDDLPTSNIIDEDTREHGGWWPIKNETDVKPGTIAIETAPYTYLMALDNGRFIVGAPHQSGEGPYPEEIMTLIKPPDSNYITFKTGYGKYVGVDKSGSLNAVAEAISAKEKWEIIYEDEKTALLSSFNNCFLSFVTNEDGFVEAKSKKAADNEIVLLRTNRERNVVIDSTPDIDKKESKMCEISYVKMYQHSKVKLNTEAHSDIDRSRQEGSLHETLLDRRQKMKSDKFCK